VVAGACTAAAAVATVGIVALARTDTDAPFDRLAFWGWGVAVAACIVAWTVVAITTARRLSWPAAILRVESLLAGALTVAMAVMTTATVVWWVGLARSASWFFTGRPVGQEGGSLALLMVAATLTMVTATVLAMVGSWRALRGVSGLRGGGVNA
jgi:hypothetical protein